MIRTQGEFPCPADPKTLEPAHNGEIITKRGVAKNLDKCSKRQEALNAAEASSRPIETLWHLRVQDAYDQNFWLDLEMVDSATLVKLDQYLRAIWLECCGHLSEFTIGGWGGVEVGKASKAKAIFEPGLAQPPSGKVNPTFVRELSSNRAAKGWSLSRCSILTLIARLTG